MPAQAPWHDIDKTRARNQLGTPSFADGTAINALDTETAGGNVFMLACDFADEDGVRVWADDENKRPLPADRLLELLTHGKMRNAINVWFNLKFDAHVLLKGLPEMNLREIQEFNATSIPYTNDAGDELEWDIVYLPKKMLKIQDGHGNSYTHYDASQFTYCGGLEDSAEEWLGEPDAKADDDLDMDEFEMDDDGERVNAYLRDRWHDIRRYIQQDCALTRRIMDEIVETAESLDPAIPFGRPYSTGYVAADYIRNRLDHKPGFAADRVQEAAWHSYRGGRFEVFERGDVGEVAGPDINSAYPAVMKDLPDPATLSWGGFGPDYVGDIDALADGGDFAHPEMGKPSLGFVKVRATTDADRRIQPFAVKNPDKGHRVEYPALDGATVWTILPIFEFARDEDYLVDYEVEAAVLGYESDATDYPFEFFAELYDDRKTFEDEGREKAAKLLKIVMNSIYGKTCQTTEKREVIPEDEEFDLADLGEHERFDSASYGDPRDPDFRQIRWREHTEAGRLFNPVLAAYITGMTRLKLHSAVVYNDLEDDTYMLATDCLMVDRDAFEGTALHEKAEHSPDSYADALGGWDYDYEGRAFIVGSGVYEVEKDDGELKKGVRGFKELHATDKSLREKAAECDERGIPVETKRPITIGDCLHLNKPTSRVGSFIEGTPMDDDSLGGRWLTASMDSKRRWERGADVTFDQLLGGAERSKPRVFDGDAWE